MEFIDAESSHQQIPPSSSDINAGDVFNCFVDIKLLTIKDEGLYARIGRQELLFGSQRLVGPSDWSNTMRTFQGASLYYYGDPYSFQTFLTRPVIVSPYQLDTADDNQIFAGILTANIASTRTSASTRITSTCRTTMPASPPESTR